MANLRGCPDDLGPLLYGAIEGRGLVHVFSKDGTQRGSTPGHIGHMRSARISTATIRTRSSTAGVALMGPRF